MYKQNSSFNKVNKLSGTLRNGASCKYFCPIFEGMALRWGSHIIYFTLKSDAKQADP